MNHFEEYLHQGEPNKAEKAKVWKVAIGLQQVDGLKTSEYLLQTASQNIEGDITIEEVKKRLDNYYKQHPPKSDEDRTEEADKVAARITEILSEKTFTFSPVEYMSIHRRLFSGIYKHAGQIRKYNITKQEWVLDGETVLYGSANSLKSTIEFDFKEEKLFNYSGMNLNNIIEHVASFISNLWQIHLFGEGNTRTTAIFLIKYLRKLGFKDVNNDLFENHSLYFRNALVRANYEDLSKGIYKTNKFLLLFFDNLLQNKNHTLKNRNLHVAAVTKDIDPVYDPVNDPVKTAMIKLILADKNITIEMLSTKLNVSTSTIKRKIRELKSEAKLERAGSDKKGFWRINIGS
ncbi:MAG: Fic family protein [Crocinitomicaceae bacterium]|nr:Fic family protein [Crocinitomicaceae bacterium]